MIDTAPALAITFQPMLSTATGLPFAYRAVAEGAGRRAFAAVAAALAPEQRPALEAHRIGRAIAEAAAAGMLDSDALLAIPLGSVTGKSEALLGHLFRTALQHRFPTARIIVEIKRRCARRPPLRLVAGEPRGPVPQHRRLSHHRRTTAAAPAPRPAVRLAAAI